MTCLHLKHKLYNRNLNRHRKVCSVDNGEYKHLLVRRNVKHDNVNVHQPCMKSSMLLRATCQIWGAWSCITGYVFRHRILDVYAAAIAPRADPARFDKLFLSFIWVADTGSCWDSWIQNNNWCRKK